MAKQLAVRQRIRKALLMLFLLLFPVILNFMSPYVIIDGASQGIASGSLLVFAGLFVSSLLVGRLWCGWVCPGGALGEVCFPINNRPVNGRKIDWIKWLIWVPWLSLIVFLFIKAGGIQQINFLHLTETGISVDEPAKYFIYFIVLGLFFTLSAVVGRRAGCHTICWMAPFMILGRKLNGWLHLPGLRLQAEPDQCRDCRTCTTNCPMSLDVNGMVRRGKMENSECILCGMCVDGCASKAIRYTFKP